MPEPATLGSRLDAFGPLAAILTGGALLVLLANTLTHGSDWLALAAAGLCLATPKRWEHR